MHHEILNILEAVPRLNLTVFVDDASVGTEGATRRAAARTMFSARTERPDAVFVASDHMAFAVLDVLRQELGLKVPQEVSVVGFDNVPQAAWGAYGLTTFEQPVDPMIEATVTLLQERLTGGEDAPARNIIVPGSLVVRSSARIATAPPAPARRRAR